MTYVADATATRAAAEQVARLRRAHSADVSQLEAARAEQQEVLEALRLELASVRGAGGGGALALGAAASSCRGRGHSIVTHRHCCRQERARHETATAALRASESAAAAQVMCTAPLNCQMRPAQLTGTAPLN